MNAVQEQKGRVGNGTANELLQPSLHTDLSKDLSAGIKKCNRGVNYEVLQRSVRARGVSEALSAQTASSPGTRHIMKPFSGTA